MFFRRSAALELSRGLKPMAGVNCFPRRVSDD